MNDLEPSSLSFPNPFRDGIVGDAWDTETADVPEIHADVFEACLQAVNHVRSLDTTAGLIIHGAAGSGKTHLVRRLRTRLTDHLATPNLSQLEQIFAYVRLDTSPRAIARHVRNRVATDLLRRSAGGGINQFELMVVARVMAFRNAEGDMLHWWEYFRNERANEIQDVLCDVGEACNMSSNFVRVLTHLIARKHRLDVAAWLRGESLTASSYERLGVGSSEEDDPEVEALHVLRDFARLAGSHLPLVICFDQVEALQTDANDDRSLFAFGHLIRNLCNSNQNLLLISCMQSSLFSQLQNALPEYQASALQTFDPQSLNPLRADDAEQLLLARLQAARFRHQSQNTQDGLWPLTRDDVSSWVGPHGTTPRKLLFAAAEAFDAYATHGNDPKSDDDEPEEAALDQWLSQKWDERIEKAQRDCTAEHTTTILRNSLPDLLHLVDPSWHVTDDQIPGLECVIEGEQQEARVGVAVLDNSPQRLPRQLAKVLECFPGRGDLQKLVLLRDERIPVSRTAHATRERLQQLEQNDAVMHWVAPDASEALEAARSLLAAAKSGDLSFEGSTVSHRTVIDWLRANLPATLTQTGEVLVLPGAGREIDSALTEKLQELLVTECVYCLDKAAEAIGASPHDVEDVARRRNDLFGLVSGTPSAVFSVRFGVRSLSSSSSN